VSAMSSGSWKVLKVGAPGHGSYSLTKVKYTIMKVVICIFKWTKVNYIIFKNNFRHKEVNYDYDRCW